MIFNSVISANAVSVVMTAPDIITSTYASTDLDLNEETIILILTAAIGSDNLTCLCTTMNA